MTSLFSSETFSKNMRLILLYYLGYNILLILIQLSTVSLMAFFHFLLDHDMGVVENWLNINAWELLTFSKGLGFILMIKTIRLNLYNLPSFKKILRNKVFFPSLQALVVVMFLNIMGIAIINNHYGDLVFNSDTQISMVITSYVGTSLFYLLDFLFIFYLFENVSIVKKRNKLILLGIMGMMFLVVTNILQPYSVPNQLMLLIYFVTLLLVYFKDRRNFANPIVICLGWISLFTIIYGHDLVWKNQYAILLFDKMMPLVGTVLSWMLALAYYLRKTRS